MVGLKVFFHYLEMFLARTSMLLNFMKFSKFSWHSRVVAFLEEILGVIITGCYIVFAVFFECVFSSWMRDLIALLNYGGSLSSQTIVSWWLKLLSIFIIVLLKIEIFWLTLVLRKALSQIKSVIPCLISLVFACL